MRWSLGWLSSIANWMTGGDWPETICQRVARKYGTSCRFCRVVAAVLRDPDHCLKQIGGQDP